MRVFLLYGEELQYYTEWDNSITDMEGDLNLGRHKTWKKVTKKQ